MQNKIFKDILVSDEASIKVVMRSIDYSGLRVAYIVDKKNKLVGVVSDSEIRKAILKGRDIKDPIKNIVNTAPVVLTEKDLLLSDTVRKKVKKLLKLMPDSRYMLVLDNTGHPKKIVPCGELLGKTKATAKKRENYGRNVLVVGGAGYIGSVLVRKLLSQGFNVRVLDMLMYGSESLSGLYQNRGFDLIEGDMRNISTVVRALEGIDVVINLAAIVGDPACKNKPEAAIETNYLANKALAEACKYNQINRFIYASTCSVYGAMNGYRELNESAPLNPVSLYARSKIQSEEGILNLEDENFAPTILRMGTMYGYSPRMRFDLVVNAMTKSAVTEKKIFVHNGGKQWRPLLHVEDAAEAYIKCIKAPVRRIKGAIFNVGSYHQNYQILRIAETVANVIPGTSLVVEEKNEDPRNYIVSFSRIERLLRFKAVNRIRKTVMRIKQAIDSKEVREVNDSKYYNVEYST